MHVPVIYSLVLSQIFGLHMLIYALLMLSRPHLYRKPFMSIKSDSAVIQVAASMALFIGIILVVTHNIWVWKPRLLVTVLCWCFFLNALSWLAIPEKMLAFTHKLYSGIGYYIIIGILITFGLFLFLAGIHVFIFITQFPGVPQIPAS